MGAYQGAELPKDLLQARGRFQAWRSRCLGRGRIPQELWELAVQLVRRHGVSRTASVLRLDYYSLKKRAETAGSERPPRSPAFVELPSPVLTGKQCLFELDNRAGTTLRVQLIGFDTADLETLARHFGNAG
jgi:hypothetical protein